MTRNCLRCGRELSEEDDGPVPVCSDCIVVPEPDPHPSDRTAVLPESVRPKGTPPPAASVRRHFAHYEIIDQLGRGGMGVVYKAYDRQLRRVVALKVLLAAEHAAHEEIERFFIEASSAGSLQHPNIVAIHELKVHEGRHYYTMDYIDGQPLDILIRDRQLNVRQSLEVIEKTARALHYSHQRGIVHRDIKPANIIVDPSGEPKITDFGLAKIMTADGSRSSGLTRSGTAIGTPHYEAPEQAAGHGDEVDARTDVYSLGCVLYELVAGTPPFSDENPIEILRMHLDKDPVPPRRLGASICEDVETIVLKCLEKEPGRRYQSAGEFAEDIRRFLNGEPITARRASLGYVIRKMLARHKTIAWTAGVAALLIVASTAVYIVNISIERDKAVAAGEAERRARQRAELEAYRYAIAEANRLLLSGRNADGKVLLAGLPEHLWGWEYTHLTRAAESGSCSAIMQTSPAAELSCIAFSADGELLAAGCSDGTVLTGRVADWNASLKRISSDSRVCAAAFNPNGGLLATGHDDGSVRLWHMPSGELARTLRGHRGGVTAVAFPPAGAIFASSSLDGTVRCWDTASGSPLSEMRYRNRKEQPLSLAFCPDGIRVAAYGSEGTLAVWEAGSGTDLLAVRDEAANGPGVAFSGDGAKLITWGKTAWIGLRLADSGQEILRLKGHASTVMALSVPPGRNRKAFSCDQDGVIREWNLDTGQTEKTVLSMTASLPRIHALSPDGTRLARYNVSRTLEVLAAQECTEPLSVAAHPNGVQCLAFSPDGRLLASGGRDSTVQVWECSGRSTPTKLASRRSEEWVSSLAFHSDGRKLVMADGHGQLTCWDWSSGLVEPAGRPEEGARVAAISPDGLCFASGAHDGRVALRHVGNAGLLCELDMEGSNAYETAFSQNGDMVACGTGDNRVLVCDRRSGRRIAMFRGLTGRTTIAFSPPGTTPAIGTAGNMIAVWDLGSPEAKPRWSNVSLPERLSALTFSPDGARLIAGSDDGNLTVWETRSGSPLLEIKAHNGRVTSIAFDKVSGRMVTGGIDGTIRFWCWDCGFPDQSADTRTKK